MKVAFVILLVSVSIGLAKETQHTTPPGMVYISGGEYKPLYAKEAKAREVPAFFMGTMPVTNGEFLAFVREHPEWRKSKVSRALADENFLRHWKGDLDLGPDAQKTKTAPVTNVSWFAARAYCEARRLRLPTQDEWEYVARADATRVDASMDQAFLRQLLEWYSKPATAGLPNIHSAEPNVYGLRGLHGFVWEWVHDFNSTMIVGDSRGDESLERKLFCGAGSLLASDVSNYAAFMRYAFRSSLKGTYCVGSLGFRVARSLHETTPTTLTVGTPYALKSKWRTQDGREITLDSLAGKVRVVTMGFTHCPYSCPRIVGDMQQIESALGDEVGQAGFVFISIDPMRDTPARLAAFCQERNLNPNHWTLLSGDPESVRELAVAMDFKYQQVEKDFAHSNLIVALDAHGTIVHRRESLGEDIEPTVTAIRRLLKKS